MVKVLVSDPISDEGLEVLKQGVEVDYLPDLTQKQLIAKIGDFEALMVRSKSKVTAEVINAGTKLRIIGRAGVGVDNIDVNAATQRGIVVVNSPEGNTIAAAELAFALMLALARNIPQADASLRSGEWERNKFIGTEVYKKTLGIVGMGRIGTEVAKRAKAFRMTVIANDPFLSEERSIEIGVESVSLEDLYKRSDFITLHVPKTPETAGMINAEAISMMKTGVRIINAARGGIIDEEALANAIKSEKVAGAALDVFSSEPPSADLDLINLSQDVVTPHLGASTEEAQVLV
ncbi:MAG: hydroxyacid dehydrogenase, partial [bacterium]